MSAIHEEYDNLDYAKTSKGESNESQQLKEIYEKLAGEKIDEKQTDTKYSEATLLRTEVYKIDKPTLEKQQSLKDEVKKIQTETVQPQTQEIHIQEQQQKNLNNYQSSKLYSFFYIQELTQFLLNLALICLGIIELGHYQFTCKVRDDRDQEDISEFLKYWLIAFTVAIFFYSLFYFIHLLMKNREGVNIKARLIIAFIGWIFFFFLILWNIGVSVILWGFDGFECKEQEVEDILLFIFALLWIECGFQVLIFLQICCRKRSQYVVPQFTESDQNFITLLIIQI